MEAVLTQIAKLTKEQTASSSQVIATILLQAFRDNKFPSSKELSEEAIISESSITIFAKKLGYSGYRELIARLKYEREHYSPYDRIGEQNYHEVFQTIKQGSIANINFFDQYQETIYNIVEAIQKSQRVFIFASYQLKSALNLFVEQLMLFNKNVIKMDHTLQLLDCENMVQADDLVLAFMSGQDNSHLVFLLESTFKKTDRKFLFTTYSQQNRVKIKEENKVVLDNVGPHQLYVRLTNLNYLLTQIIGILNHMISTKVLY